MTKNEFDPSLISARLLKALRVGQDLASFTYEITGNDVRDFLIATGQSAGGLYGAFDPGTYQQLPAGTKAPATYFAALDPVERRDLVLPDYLSEIPFAQTGGGNANAFNEVRYQRPFVVGDVITVTTKYTEAYERQGHVGRLLFRVRESRFIDAEGSLVAVTRSGHVCAFDMDSPIGEGDRR